MSDDYITGAKGIAPEDPIDAEKSVLELAFPGATYLTGSDITYSSGRGYSVYKAKGDYAGGAGGVHGLYSYLTLSGALTDAGAGIVGVKSVVVNTAHQADGNIYAGQFIAKHTSTSLHMHAEACLIGIEAIGYDSATASAGVGVMIGVNAVIRSYATGAYSGGVHRGIQIIVDEAVLGATEVTALCIWNMGATAIGGIRVVGAATMANLLYFDAAGGCVNTGSLKDSNGETNIECDAYIVCAIGATPYYIPLYNTLN